MKLIVNIKLKPLESQHAALLATMKEANKACDWISKEAFEYKVFKQFNLHKLVYRVVRDTFNLSAQMVVRQIAKVTDNYKIQTEKQTTFKPLGSIAYDDRIISFKKPDIVSIWTVEGRLNIPFVMGEHQRKLFQYRKGEVDLIYRKGQFFLNAVCDVPEPEKLGFNDILGCDFGIINIVTDSTGEPFSGKEIEQVRQKYSDLRQTLQKKASAQTKDGKRPRSIHRFLKRIGKKERNFRKHSNHCISKQIVDKAKTVNSAIALEDLSGIRKRVEKRFKKHQRTKVSGWSFFELRQNIEYKSRMHGVSVFLVDPKNTSRECSECGYTDKENRKSQSEFLCLKCSHKENADFNAAKVISGRAKRNLAQESETVVSKGTSLLQVQSSNL